MCFRPTKAVVHKCPHCGKPVNAIEKFLPKKCPYCGEAMDSAKTKDKKDTQK